MTLQIVLKSFSLEPLLVPSPSGQVISLIGSVLAPGLARVQETISQQIQPKCRDLSQKPRHSLFLEVTAFVFSTDGQQSFKDLH